MPSAGSSGTEAAARRAVRLRGHDVELAADAHGDEAETLVVFLHGGGQTRHAWGTAAAELARSGYYALAVDLRGHGESEWSPDGDYSLGAFAADAIAISDALPRLPALVGASLGGLGSLIAVGETDRPVATCLVLVDVTPRVEQQGVDRILGFMRRGVGGFERLEDAADAIAAYLPDRPRPKDLSGLQKNLRLQVDGRWYWHWDPRFVHGQGGLDGQEGKVDHSRLAAAARLVTIPTLLVRGRMSDVVSDESVRELEELVPHAEVVDVAQAGHMVAGDQNDAFNEAVLDFVARAVPR